MKELVFIHGRSQQHKDSVALKYEWVEAFSQGLHRSGLQVPIPENAIHFPYYGDTLNDLVHGAPAERAADITVRGEDGCEFENEFRLKVIQEIYEAVIQEQGPQAAAIIDEAARGEVIEKGVLNWPWVRAILTQMDRYIPLASGASIALFTLDVYSYLRNPGIRDRIEEGVRRAMGANPTVIVSHSLGTIVAYNLLRREGMEKGWRVPLFVTLGSPLAVTMVRAALSPVQHPMCADRWFNAMDPRDIVALYPLDTSRGWGISPAIENRTDVDNPTENRHGISGYLGDQVVARRIYDALCA